MIGVVPKLGIPSPQTVNVKTIPAPWKGVDARIPAYDMPLENCIFTFNMMPAEYGMLLRYGFREWVTEIEETPFVSTGVRTLMAFEGVDTGAADDRLFAATNEGIWDITTFNTAPVLKIGFSSKVGDAGHGVYCHYIDQSGAVFLLYADSENGLFEYSESTDNWVVPTNITGPVIANIAYVVVHKQRLWLVEQDSTSAWYLPVASKDGLAIEFFFGSKFPHGGRLVALINWTVDGGLGVDDFLVLVSAAGDVIPYQGDDPSSADTWQLKGTYFIGKLPRGRRISGEYAGNLYLLSTFGLIAMSDLLRGVDTREVSSDSLSMAIALPLRLELELRSNDLTWEPKFIPSQGMMVIVSSSEENDFPQQYALNIATGGWGIWRGVPMLCLEEYQGKIYFGTLDKTVQVMDEYKDAVKNDPVDPQNNGIPIEFSLLTAYTSAGAEGIFKRVQMVRPDFHGPTTPNIATKTLYDYELGQPAIPAGAPPNLAGDLWNAGVWDAAIWSASFPKGFNKLQGGSGVGRNFAVAMRGESTTDLRFISMDIMWNAGGPI